VGIQSYPYEIPTKHRAVNTQAEIRPIIFFMRQGTCWQPELKGLILMDNCIFNSWRMEDVWFDR